MNHDRETVAPRVKTSHDLRPCEGKRLSAVRRRGAAPASESGDGAHPAATHARSNTRTRASGDRMVGAEHTDA